MADTLKHSIGVESASEFLTPRNPELRSGYESPRNEVEQAIVEIWQKLLGIKQIGIHDNYFDLGGTSVLAVRMFAQIEKIMGKKLPLSVLINAPTVEQLAGIVTDEEWSARWSPLVMIQPGGSKPPFFFIHGAGGNILNYRDLARHLGPDQPVYGLQSQGLDGNQPFLTRVEDMASRYIQEIQSVQPQGPYYLGGYCLGGTIALEMAQQLHVQGRETALLVLLETYNYSNVKTQSLLDNAYFQIQRIKFHGQNFLLLKSKEKLIFIWEKLKVAKGRTKIWVGMLLSKFWHRRFQYSSVDVPLNKLWETNDWAAGSYVPKPCPTQITLFLPLREYRRYDNPEAGWDKLALAGLETYRLPVYPAGMMVEPFVRLLAEELRDCMDKAIENRTGQVDTPELASSASVSSNGH
jgi:thioesterase domain-containing protein